MLETFLSFFQTHSDGLTKAMGAVGTVSGWVAWLNGRRRDNLVVLTVEVADGSLCITNHGEHPLELLSSSVYLRDPYARPDLAANSTLVLGVFGVVEPKTQRKLAEIAPIAAEAEKISAPLVAELSARQPGMFVPRTAAMELTLRCVRVGDHRVRTVVLDRQLSGHPQHGWSVGYSPYHHEMNLPPMARVWAGLKAGASVSRHPVRAWKRRRQMREAQRVLDVRGVLQAMASKVISLEDGERRLRLIAKQAKVTPEALLARCAPEVFGPTGAANPLTPQNQSSSV